MIVLVETIASERDPHPTEYLAYRTPAVGVRTGGESVVGERLTHLKLALAGLTAVLVGRHGGWLSPGERSSTRWQRV